MAANGDFIDKEPGAARPYGVHDLKKNEAWVSVGINHDTGEFAVQTIRTWWKEMGASRYPDANSIVITADGEGSNGYRLRLWKLELQGLVNELRFPITDCHLPPGTSKWNKIEHRLFSFIEQNWRGMSREARRRDAAECLTQWLTVRLVDRGYEPRWRPGVGLRLWKGQDSLQAREVVAALETGSLTATDWVARCASL